MRIVYALLALAGPAPLLAQSMSGPASAIDGDTLVMAGERIRLHGIDAPESMQTCQRGGAAWTCGREAGGLLAGLVAGRIVSCTARHRDAYRRIVATCHVGERDLAGVMVREGLAVALPRFSFAYVETEAKAKAFKMALWSSSFEIPADYRAANTQLFKAPVVTTAARSSRAAKRVQAPVAFRNCAAARAAGAAPLYRGQPGYGAHMDGDGDGVACERYRGRG